MVATLAVTGLALRAGLGMRRARQLRVRRDATLLRRHLRLAKPGVAMVLLGFAGGVLSAVQLRDWTPFQGLHPWLGALALTLFVLTAAVGRQLERGRSRAVNAHGLMGLLAFLSAAVAAVAGMVLLP